MADPMTGKLSFWDRKEGKVGTLVLAGGFAILFIIMLTWGPAIIAALMNTTILIASIVAIVAGIWFFTQPRIKTLIGVGFKMIMKKITGLFWQIDPIAILKDYVDRLKDKRERMSEQLDKLRGGIRRLKDIMSNNERQAKNLLALAEEAKDRGIRAQVALKTRQAGRRQENNAAYQELYTRLELLYRVLSKMYENTGIIIEDTEDSVQQEEIKWNTMKTAHSAMKSAMSIINGNKDERALYEETLQFMADDLGNKIGEMERFMEMSESFMQGADLEQGVYEKKGLEMLEQWEKQADSWVLGAEKSKIIADAHNPANVLNIDVPNSMKSDSQFNSLFNK